MANTAKTASTFRALALVTLALLLVAVTLVYLGKGSAPAGGQANELQRMSASARSIVATSADLDTLHAALAAVAQRATLIVERSNSLLDVSGGAGPVLEFQQRADRIRQTAMDLVRSGDAAKAKAMTDDIAYLRSVVDALAGGDSPLDIRPLGAGQRDTVLLPIEEALSDLENQAETVVANVGAVAASAAALEDLDTSTTRMSGANAGAADSVLPAVLQSAWIPIGLVALAAILVVVLLFLNSKSSSFERMAKEQADQNERNQQAILRLLDEMGSLADGDLTVEATVTEDITGTIADSFNYAIEELRKLVATVNETSIMVDSAAKQTENTAAHMAKAAENQAREINAATESVVSMAKSIEEVSGNAERSSDVARHSVEVAHKGGEAVRRTIDGMNAIRETIQDTSKRIKRLGESSQEIGNIVELINDIAEQTNILALNASIQASMAGEAGRGFAVVADEVQRLAERSTNATKQIEVLVRTIQADTNEAVVSMERSTTDVVGGALLAENAGAALDEIEQVSNQIASLVQNISGSARQQAGSAADVTRRTTRLREISEQTGKATTATAAAISKLSELASQLRKTVAGFTLPSQALHSSTLVASSDSMPVVKPADGQAKAS